MDELGLTSGRQAEGPPFFILINQRPDQALHVSLATTCDYSSLRILTVPCRYLPKPQQVPPHHDTTSDRIGAGPVLFLKWRDQGSTHVNSMKTIFKRTKDQRYDNFN